MISPACKPSKHIQFLFRSPSPPRATGLPASYYRQPSTSSSAVSSARPFATSAVSSVSASAIYAHSSGAQQAMPPTSSAGYPYTAAAGREDAAAAQAAAAAAAAAAAGPKPVYLSQADIAAVRSTASAIPVSTLSSSRMSYAQQQSLAAAAQAAERDRAVQQQRALAAAVAAPPPAAHSSAAAAGPPGGAAGGFRSGSIVSGYPRAVVTAATAGYPAPHPQPPVAVSAGASRLLQAPPAPQPNGMPRYYSQREV